MDLDSTYNHIMRNLHQFIREEYGINVLRNLVEWENVENKLSDFRNHHKFSIRCLFQDITLWHKIKHQHEDLQSQKHHT